MAPSKHFTSLSLPSLSLPWQTMALLSQRGSVWSQEDTLGNSVWELGKKIILPFSSDNSGFPRPLPACPVSLYFLFLILSWHCCSSVLSFSWLRGSLSCFSLHLIKIVFLLPCWLFVLYNLPFVIHSFFFCDITVVFLCRLPVTPWLFQQIFFEHLLCM